MTVTAPTTDPRAFPPTHGYPGTNPVRQSVGKPGHCEPCAEHGHVAAHPDLGCGDVGCTSHHDEDTTDDGPTEADIVKLLRAGDVNPEIAALAAQAIEDLREELDEDARCMQALRRQRRAAEADSEALRDVLASIAGTASTHARTTPGA